MNCDYELIPMLKKNQTNKKKTSHGFRIGLGGVNNVHFHF